MVQNRVERWRVPGRWDTAKDGDVRLLRRSRSSESRCSTINRPDRAWSLRADYRLPTDTDIDIDSIHICPYTVGNSNDAHALQIRSKAGQAARQVGGVSASVS